MYFCPGQQEQGAFPPALPFCLHAGEGTGQGITAAAAPSKFLKHTEDGTLGVKSLHCPL